jgi:hypothetical protein
MAWKEKSADEISMEIFGEPAAKVKERLAKLEGIESSVAAVKDLATTQAGGIDELKNMVREMKVTSPYSSQQQQQQQEQNNQQESTDWSVDADKAFRERSAPLVGGILETRALIAKRNVMDEINSKHPDKQWGLFADEINNVLKNLSPADLAQEQCYRNVYYKVVGENMDNILRDRAAKTGKFFTETGGASSIMHEDEKKPEDKLTPEQVDMAKKFGITPEIYAKELATMKVV